MRFDEVQNLLGRRFRLPCGKFRSMRFLFVLASFRPALFGNFSLGQRVSTVLLRIGFGITSLFLGDNSLLACPVGSCRLPKGKYRTE